MIAALLAASLASTPSPYEVYERALTAMRTVAVPAYIEYTESTMLRHETKLKEIVSIVSERSSDHRARYVGTHPDGTPTNDVQVAQAFLPADLFLGKTRVPVSGASAVFQVGTDSASDVPTIATIYTSSRYTIDLTAIEPHGWCASAYHLSLTPKGDPVLDNLRELWVDRTTFRICAARAARVMTIGSRVVAIMAIELRPDGYVSAFSTTATGRMLGFPYTLTEEDSMSDPVAVSSVPGL